MRIFLDHCVPKRLMYLLTDEYEVKTAQQMNWADKKNGAPSRSLNLTLMFF